MVVGIWGGISDKGSTNPASKRDGDVSRSFFSNPAGSIARLPHIITV
jgi:hypothetical protein